MTSKGRMKAKQPRHRNTTNEEDTVQEPEDYELDAPSTPNTQEDRAQIQAHLAYLDKMKDDLQRRQTALEQSRAAIETEVDALKKRQARLDQETTQTRTRLASAPAPEADEPGDA